MGFFSFGRQIDPLTTPGRAERTCSCGILSRKGIIMPVWMDILLNVIGYAGFVGVATFNHSREDAAAPSAERVS